MYIKKNTNYSKVNLYLWLTFNKSPMAFHEERMNFPINSVERNWIYTCKEINLDPDFTPYTKTNSG